MSANPSIPVNMKAVFPAPFKDSKISETFCIASAMLTGLLSSVFVIVLSPGTELSLVLILVY